MAEPESSPDPVPNVSLRPTPHEVALGLFVSFQIFFLLAYNHLLVGSGGRLGVGEAGAGPPSLYAAARDRTKSALRGWAQVTGQEQGWALFAPLFPHQAAFPAVELVWKSGARTDGGESEILLAGAEPADPRSYFRPPWNYRGQGFETNLVCYLLSWDETEAASRPAFWRDWIEENLRERWRPSLAYLRTRLERFRAERPDLPPPQEVRLLVRLHATPPPGSEPGTRPSPAMRPVARWRPGAPIPAGVLPLERWDPAAGEFTTLTAGR